MARKTKMRKRTHKYRRNCKCKACCKQRNRTRSRRGGTQTAVGGNMIYQGGRWNSFNPLGGRS